MSDTKACPFCAEEIKTAAVKCKHCGETLEECSVPGVGKRHAQTKALIAALVLLAIVGLVWTTARHRASLDSKFNAEKGKYLNDAADIVSAHKVVLKTPTVTIQKGSSKVNSTLERATELFKQEYEGSEPDRKFGLSQKIFSLNASASIYVTGSVFHDAGDLLSQPLPGNLEEDYQRYKNDTISLDSEINKLRKE